MRQKKEWPATCCSKSNQLRSLEPNQGSDHEPPEVQFQKQNAGPSGPHSQCERQACSTARRPGAAARCNCPVPEAFRPPQCAPSDPISDMARIDASWNPPEPRV